MRKYYRRRYHLFKRFDSGILMDLEGWYSVTPEAVADHVASAMFTKLGSKSGMTVLDAFCGCSGNSIQLAKYFDTVIACDLDFKKLQCSQHNSSHVYQVPPGRIQFVMQDFFLLHKTFRIPEETKIQTTADENMETSATSLSTQTSGQPFKLDAIFLSPPWGGVNYVNEREVDISELPLDYFKVFSYCIKQLKCRNICFFLPRNTNLEQILYLAGPGGRLEIEQNFLNHKFVAISAYI